MMPLIAEMMYHWMTGRTMNNESLRMSKEILVAQLTVLSQHLAWRPMAMHGW